MSRPALTPTTADAILEPRPKRLPERLWGAKVIAEYIGTSVDMVYSLAKRGDCPIYRPSGRYYARRSELDSWLKTKPKAA